MSATTTISDEQVDDLARRHEAARLEVKPMRQITLDHPNLTIADAYAIQARWTDLQLKAGAVLKGRKIGLTSKVMQAVMRIDEPDYGALMDWMFIDDGATVPAAQYLDPKLEVELAFVLGDDLASDPTIEDVLAATREVVPAVELIDARSFRVDPDSGRPRTVIDTIADNAADAGIVLGTTTVAHRDIDLRWVAAVLRQNGTIVESGVSAAVLDHPANGIVWLARRLGEFGVHLHADEVILSGSFTRPVDVHPGDRFVADYGPLGTLSVNFS